MFGLTQITKPLTVVTRSSTSLTDRILASLPETMFQEGVANNDLSDHQLIYCTRKISKIKTRGLQNN